MAEYRQDVNLSFIANPTTGLGTEYDSISGMEVTGHFFNSSLEWLTFEQLYRNSWICQRVVDYYPEMMILGWGELLLAEEIPEETEEQIRKQLDALKYSYCQGQKMANLYGDGYIIKLIDDGGNLEDPVNFENIRSVSYSRIYDYREVDPEILAFQIDYYNPEYYRFTARVAYDSGIDSNAFATNEYLVHRDRVLRFRGKFLPPNAFERNRYRYSSVLEDFLLPLMRLEQSLAHVSDAMKSFEVILLGIEDLFETIANGTEEEISNLKGRLKLLHQEQSSMRGISHDKDSESINIMNRQFGNVDQMLDQLRKELVAASGLSLTQLYNEHPSGMQATGESERRKEAQQILAKQKLIWDPLIEQDLKYIMASYGIYEGYKWEWTSVYQESEKEKLEKRKMLAEIDNLYLATGVLQTEEVRNRFAGSEFSNEIELLEKKEVDLPENQQAKKPEKEEDQKEQLNQDAVDKFIVYGRVLAPSEYAPTDPASLKNIKSNAHN